MSQIYKTSSGGSLPPDVPTSFVTQDGTAIPSGNVLQVQGDFTSDDDDSGIQTRAEPNLSNNLEIQLTNRLFGNATSINGSTEQLIGFVLAGTPSVYRFNFSITGRDTGTGDGVGYSVDGSAKTDGATATIIATPLIDNDEDSSLLVSSVALSTAGNTINLTVTGVAGHTIVYKSVGTYVRV